MMIIEIEFRQFKMPGIKPVNPDPDSPKQRSIQKEPSDCKPVDSAMLPGEEIQVNVSGIVST